MKRQKNTILITFSYVSNIIDSLIEDKNNPVKNPPKCPKASTLAVPMMLKKKMNVMIMTDVQQSWHLSKGPIRSKPRQLMSKYPMMTPITPYKEVDAPALIFVESIKAEKILPPIPERM